MQTPRSLRLGNWYDVRDAEHDRLSRLHALLDDLESRPDTWRKAMEGSAEVAWRVFGFGDENAALNRRKGRKNHQGFPGYLELAEG